MTSTMTCAVPKAFRIDTCLVPRPTTTRLGTVWLAITLRFDVAGTGRPAGQTDTKLVAVGCVTVTFSADGGRPGGHAPDARDREVADLAWAEHRPAEAAGACP